MGKELYITEIPNNRGYEDEHFVIENPKEIQDYIMGTKILEFSLNTGCDDESLGAFCNGIAEIQINFSSGKEMRIFINEDGKLQVYTD